MAAGGVLEEGTLSGELGEGTPGSKVGVVDSR